MDDRTLPTEGVSAVSRNVYQVSISNGEVTLIDRDFRTRRDAAEFVHNVIAASRSQQYLRIEIGVTR